MSTTDQEIFEKIRRRRSEELSRRILDSVNKSFVGDQTMAWLQNVNEKVQPKSTDAGEANDPPCQLPMVALIDKLFDDFQRYSYQFNQTEENRGFVVTCNTPAAGSYKAGNATYQGFLHNSVWGMVVSGDSKSIRFSFVPPRFLYQDDRPASMFFLELTPQGNPESPSWSSDGKLLRSSHIPYLSKKIFARLIRVSRAEVSDREPLILDFLTEETKVEQPDTQQNEANNVDTITYSLLSILDSIDSELLTLQQASIKALKEDGLDGLQPLMKRSDVFKALRKRTAELARDWASFISS